MVQSGQRAGQIGESLGELLEGNLDAESCLYCGMLSSGFAKLQSLQEEATATYWAAQDRHGTEIRLQVAALMDEQTKRCLAMMELPFPVRRQPFAKGMGRGLLSLALAYKAFSRSLKEADEALSAEGVELQSEGFDLIEIAVGALAARPD